MNPRGGLHTMCKDGCSTDFPKTTAYMEAVFVVQGYFADDKLPAWQVTCGAAASLPQIATFECATAALALSRSAFI